VRDGAADGFTILTRFMPWSLMNEYAANGELLETRSRGNDQAEAWLLAWVSGPFREGAAFTVDIATDASGIRKLDRRDFRE
jgi:hypothetical protein